MELSGGRFTSLLHGRNLPEQAHERIFRTAQAFLREAAGFALPTGFEINSFSCNRSIAFRERFPGPESIVHSII